MKIFKNASLYILLLVYFFLMCSVAIANNNEFDIVVTSTSNGSTGPVSPCDKRLIILRNISEQTSGIDSMMVIVERTIDNSILHEEGIENPESFFMSGCISTAGDYRYNDVTFTLSGDCENPDIRYKLKVQTPDTLIVVETTPADPIGIFDDCISPYQDSLTLVALYKLMDGANWTNTWDLDDSIDTWHGVTLNSVGGVKHLKLHSNQLNGTIPPQLGNLNSLTLLWLYNNQLSGGIPYELGNLANLVDLRLYGNQLKGSIPAVLGNLSNLKQLRLYNNQLSESIPPELGNLTKLTYLWLHNNDLTGNIPIELGNLTNLKNLYLYNNQLNGAIPSSLGNLNKVIQLRLSNNQLTGYIPRELGNMNSMVGLWLKNNQLVGCYDQNLASLCDQLSEVYSSNVYISEGNNLETPWEDFCDSETTNCLDRLATFADLTGMGIQPNPFSSTTTIEFTLSEDANVNVNILNPNGQVVKQLIQNEQMIEGKHQLNFEAIQLPAGVYYCLLTAGTTRQIQKMVIVK